MSRHYRVPFLKMACNAKSVLQVVAKRRPFLHFSNSCCNTCQKPNSHVIPQATRQAAFHHPSSRTAGSSPELAMGTCPRSCHTRPVTPRDKSWLWYAAPCIALLHSVHSGSCMNTVATPSRSLLWLDYNRQFRSGAFCVTHLQLSAHCFPISGFNPLYDCFWFYMDPKKHQNLPQIQL